MNQFDQQESSDFQIDPMDVTIGITLAIGIPVIIYAIFASMGYSPSGPLKSSQEQMAANEAEKTTATYLSLEEGKARLEKARYILEDRAETFLKAHKDSVGEHRQVRGAYKDSVDQCLSAAEEILAMLKSEVGLPEAPTAGLKSQVLQLFSTIDGKRRQNHAIELTY